MAPRKDQTDRAILAFTARAIVTYQAPTRTAIARRARRRFSGEEVMRALQRLHHRGLLEIETKLTNGENMYRLTPAGWEASGVKQPMGAA